MKEAEDIAKQYISKDYIIDQKYRYFYYHFDRVDNHTPYEHLRELVENIYTNKFLNKLSIAWTKSLVEVKADTGLIRQQDFYNRYIRNLKDRVVVIISDALRYEVGQTLMKRLQEDEKEAKITSMQAVLPSIQNLYVSSATHKDLNISDDYGSRCRVCDDLKTERLLQSCMPNN